MGDVTWTTIAHTSINSPVHLYRRAASCSSSERTLLALLFFRNGGAGNVWGGSSLRGKKTTGAEPPPPPQNALKAVSGYQERAGKRSERVGKTVWSGYCR